MSEDGNDEGNSESARSGDAPIDKSSPQEKLAREFMKEAITNIVNSNHQPPDAHKRMRFIRLSIIIPFLEWNYY